MIEPTSDVATLLRTAARTPLLAPETIQPGAAQLDRDTIQELLPHREPFLFLDAIDYLDEQTSTIAGRHGLAVDDPVFEGHFPGAARWPGVLQVEAIGQAGLCLARFLARRGAQGGGSTLALTQILGAEFVRPIFPGDDVQIVARVASDGLFTIVVGQCLQRHRVCSAAAVRGISENPVT